MVTSVPPIEIGSLNALSPNESQFLGSSSGIFFVNTVRRAFSASKAASPTQAGSSTELSNTAFIDNCITGDESPRLPQEQDGEEPALTQPRENSQYSRSSGNTTQYLGQPPSIAVARELIKVYFRLYHPLFPFLHGRSFLREVELFYSDENSALSYATNNRLSACHFVIMQCVFNIAALERPDLGFPKESRIESASALLSCFGSLVSRPDISCLQALLAGQLYLIANMSLHAASTVGGMLLKLVFHAGLHRCPYRYAQLSSHDCEIRRRIFWSTYVADRYLSQALGLPLGIQDSDIDVCVPGTDELHRPVRKIDISVATPASNEASLHLPKGHRDQAQADYDDGSVAEVAGTPIGTAPSNSEIKHHGEEALANYVAYCRLTGRALELFHKSIPVRSVEYGNILALTSDVHAFWNALPQQLQDLPYNRKQVPTKSGDDGPSLGLFFTIIYQQLILLINRPFLSLDRSSPEFRSSLQTCIGASRIIISTLKEQNPSGQYPSWPGILSGTWMSGLILAFACALDHYPLTKGFPEIQTCLVLLETMGTKWATARHCHSALKVMLNDLSPGNPVNVIPQNSNPQHQATINKRSRPSDTSQSPLHESSKRLRGADFENVITSDNDQGQLDSQDRTRTRSDADFWWNNNYGNTGSNVVPGVDQISDLQWAPTPGFGSAAPYTDDIFGYLIWESLVQDNGPQAGFWPDTFTER